MASIALNAVTPLLTLFMIFLAALLPALASSALSFSSFSWLIDENRASMSCTHQQDEGGF